MIDRRTLFAAAALAPLAALPAVAEDPAERRLREDWPWLGRYAADNRRLIASGAKTGIVFMGDSITEGWGDKRPGFFGAGRVGRGIGGQTTPQMLLRMMADVVQLKPRAVHIMAGTNDIAGNTGPMTPEMTQANLNAMADISRAHGILLLLASIPPAAGFPWRPGLDTAPKIATLNAWIRDYAARTEAIWVDYHLALATPAGAMKPGLAYDGVHPTAAGYDSMATVVEPILTRMGLNA